MCGFLGFYSKFEKINQEIFKKSLNIINHRGPDNSKVSEHGNLLFGFNRLSIIDPHMRSSQPMLNNKNIIMFNGEIYNFLEIKNNFFNKTNFLTNSDTEVVLNCLSSNNYISLINEMNGMFSIASYDKEKNQLLLIRDRLGQKPLYFYKNKNSFIFSSEVKPILSLIKIYDLEYNYFDKYFFEDTDEKNGITLFKNIEQVLPGEILQLDLNKFIIKRKKWYKPNLNYKFKNFNKNKKLKLKSQIESSVEMCLLSDRETCISFSGGLDSSLLSILINKHKKINNINLIFDDDYEEKNNIKRVSKELNINSEEIIFKENDFLNYLKKSIYHLESPSGGLINVAFFKFYEEVSKKYKVIFDGTGLDEFFCGYEIHLFKYLHNLLINKNNGLENFFDSMNLSKNKTNTYIKKLSKIGNKQINIDSSTIHLDKFLNKSYQKKINFFSSTDINQFYYDLIFNTKIPKNNRLKDRSSMASGVELRQPFLDHNILEFAFKIPFEAHFDSRLRTKAVLRDIYEQNLPKSILNCKKFSIQSPQNKWITNNTITSYLLDNLNKKNNYLENMFNIDKIKNYIYINKGKNLKNSVFHWKILNFFMLIETF